ncbi:MAG: hypothetical protein CMJ25_04550 [Phycisphaerae bacterium]|nr:hypothetical protein [Phycisphaerae bacterium]
MTKISDLRVAHSESIAAFDVWLAKQNRVTHSQWQKRIKSTDSGTSEGAIAEAVVFDYLACRCESVSLNEDPSTGGPDLLFEHHGHKFLVEVTNLSIETVTRSTGLTHHLDPQSGFQYYGLLTKNIYRKCRNKTPQVSRRNHPAVLFVTTLHFQASAICIGKLEACHFLWGTEKLSAPFDAESGETVGSVRNVTHFKNSVFFREDASFSTRGICALIVGGFGLVPPDANIFGILHPKPPLSFDPSWIPHVEFARLSHEQLRAGQLVAEWVKFDLDGKSIAVNQSM